MIQYIREKLHTLWLLGDKYYVKKSDFDAIAFDFSTSQALIDYCQNKLNENQKQEPIQDTLIFIHKNKFILIFL